MAFLLLLLLFFAPPQKSTDPDQTPETESATQLAQVRRIYIAILSGGDAATQIRDLLMTSLQNSKLFLITENEDKADAVLKGSGDDEVFTETHQSSDGINAHTQFGTSSSQGLRNYSSSSDSHSGGLSIGENESQHSEERKHEAIITVRLVSKDDDVIWSATAESLGGKFLGASADAADKIARRLVADYKKARVAGGPSRPSPAITRTVAPPAHNSK